VKKPSFSPRNELGKRQLVEWTIKQWHEMQSPNEDDLARDLSQIEFPVDAVPPEARLNAAIASKHWQTFEDVMRDVAVREVAFRRLMPRPKQVGGGRPKGSRDRKAAANKSLMDWAFKVEKDILLIWANAYDDDPECLAKDRKEKPFALDVAVQILNSRGYNLNADELRSYRSNRGTRGLPRE
jgi:hypothetical protein